MIAANTPNITDQHPKTDWELDFYSRPILESDGKKRWELLISSSQDPSGTAPFRWVKRCPAGEVNSLWLTNALREALKDSQEQGWETPLRLRSWRISMRTMVQRAATELGIEVIPSRRTYALLDWLAERERDVYPLEERYKACQLPPPPTPIPTPPVPLPEAVRGDAWSWASLPLGLLREAQEWPIGFGGLLPVGANDNDNIPVPGVRMFSQTRALALAGWLGGLEPVCLVVDGTQLMLEAGQDDRWLVTDLDEKTAKAVQQSLLESREQACGLQFISVQTSPEEKRFAGFWMLRDLPQP